MTVGTVAGMVVGTVAGTAGMEAIMETIGIIMHGLDQVTSILIQDVAMHVTL